MPWLFKQSTSEFWWIGWRVNGKLFRRSTRETDRKAAERQLADMGFIGRAHAEGRLTEEFIASITGQKQKRITLVSALDDWLAERAARVGGSTMAKYKQLSDELREFLGATDKGPLLREVTTASLQAYLNRKVGKLHPTTVNHCRKALKIFFGHCTDNHILQQDPTSPIKPFDAGDGAARRAFTLQEVATLYSKCPDDFWRFMVLAGFYTGQRLGDLICMRWGSVDFGQNVLRLTTRKTGAKLTVPMALPLRAFLLELRTAAGKVKAADPIWPKQAEDYEAKGAGQFSNEFYDEVLTKAGLVAARKGHRKAKDGRDAKREATSVSFHCLRHTHVSMLKLAGAPQAAVKALAGHSSDLVSDHYTHVGDEALAASIDKLPALPEVTL